MPIAGSRATFCQRLRQAREAVGLSQRPLGMQTGLDEFVASTRINRYEVGVHEPDTGTAQRLARVLSVPPAYLYTEDELLARMILAFAALPRRRQREVLARAESGGETP